jgi:hypothetical protein
MKEAEPRSFRELADADVGIEVGLDIFQNKVGRNSEPGSPALTPILANRENTLAVKCAKLPATSFPMPRIDL